MIKLISSEEYVVRQSTSKAISGIIKTTSWILQPDIKVPVQDSHLLYACSKEVFSDLFIRLIEIHWKNKIS